MSHCDVVRMLLKLFEDVENRSKEAFENYLSDFSITADDMPPEQKKAVKDAIMYWLAHSYGCDEWAKEVEKVIFTEA